MQIAIPTLSEAVAAFLAEADFCFHRLGPDQFTFGLATDVVGMQCLLDTDDDTGAIHLTAPIAVRVPPEQFPEVTACLNMLNARLEGGTWFVEPGQGWISLRLSGHAGPPGHVGQNVLALLARARGLVDRAAQPLLTLALSGGDPLAVAEAIIEGSRAAHADRLQIPDDIDPARN